LAADGLVHQSASYQAIYGACRVDPDQFQIDQYLLVYQNSLGSTLALATTAEPFVVASIKAKGLSPYLADFLNQSWVSSALQDCLGGEDAASGFVAKMILVDAAGKVVAGSIARLAVGFLNWAAVGVLDFMLSPLGRFYTPKLAQQLLQVTTTFAASYRATSAVVKFRSAEQQAEQAGQAIVADFIQDVQQIGQEIQSLSDTEGDIQFDISVAKAEARLHHKIGPEDRKVFCQVIAHAPHRCAG